MPLVYPVTILRRDSAERDRKKPIIPIIFVPRARIVPAENTLCAALPVSL